MGMFPIDLTQRSLSFGHRLDKYTSKGFKPLLIGLPEDFNEDCLETPDGSLSKSEIERRYFFNSGSLHKTDYDDGDSEDHIFANWWLIRSERYSNVTFRFETLSDMRKFSDDEIEHDIRVGLVFKLPKSGYKKAEIDSLKDKDKIYQFMTAYYIDKDLALADTIWEEASRFYINKAKEVVKLIKDNPWKYKDPGSQSFGKFNPIIADPREWYGQKNYKPVVVGLSVERLQAFYDCRKNIDYVNMIPEEIFKIICNWWFVMEALDARDTLLNVCM